MAYILDAACGCNTGKVRKNNEDNFYFAGRCLEEQNNGLKHPVSATFTLRKEICVAVFDGMGGEYFGECASFAAASTMQEAAKKLKDYYIPEKKFLSDMCHKLNEAVLEKSVEKCTQYMGSTVVALYFSRNYVYACNLGDSRAYRLRKGEFMQLSKDHVDQRPNSGKKKAPLTQHLGISPELFLIEPYIAKGEILPGDQYLLCSDGLTDMLTNIEINSIMNESIDAEDCVSSLIDAALEKGGKDNITVIVCRVL